MKKSKLILSVSVLLFTFIQLCGCSAGVAGNEKSKGSVNVEKSDTENVQEEEKKTGSSFEGEFKLSEFAGDMYRPEGYSENICSALALKMSLHKDEPEYLYHVYLCVLADEDDEKGFILSSVSAATAFNPDEWVEVEVDMSKYIYVKHYCYQFTAEQIYAFAAARGVMCGYVGSENYDEMLLRDKWWDSDAGIEAYCEKFGDQFAIANDGSPYTPGCDIYIIE